VVAGELRAQDYSIILEQVVGLAGKIIYQLYQDVHIQWLLVD
jgi:hypothetical protein